MIPPGIIVVFVQRAGAREDDSLHILSRCDKKSVLSGSVGVQDGLQRGLQDVVRYVIDGRTDDDDAVEFAGLEVRGNLDGRQLGFGHGDEKTWSDSNQRLSSTEA